MLPKLPFQSDFENRFCFALKPVFRFCKNWSKTGLSVSGKTGLETLSDTRSNFLNQKKFRTEQCENFQFGSPLNLKVSKIFDSRETSITCSVEL